MVPAVLQLPSNKQHARLFFSRKNINPTRSYRWFKFPAKIEMAPDLGSYLRPWMWLYKISRKFKIRKYFRNWLLKFIYLVWEGHEISTIDLSSVVPVKSTMEISQNFVAFSEYMNFRSGEQNVCCKKYT